MELEEVWNFLALVFLSLGKIDCSNMRKIGKSRQIERGTKALIIFFLVCSVNNLLLNGSVFKS